MSYAIPAAALLGVLAIAREVLRNYSEPRAFMVVFMRRSCEYRIREIYGWPLGSNWHQPNGRSRPAYQVADRDDAEDRARRLRLLRDDRIRLRAAEARRR